MAEMTKDMYGAVGRLGNKTYYQRLGKTIARTITKPKNPKTESQSLHRVLVKAVNKSYSKLKEICNHSFEDYDNGFACMNKFKKVNMMYLREHSAMTCAVWQRPLSTAIGRQILTWSPNYISIMQNEEMKK